MATISYIYCNFSRVYPLQSKKASETVKKVKCGEYKACFECFWLELAKSRPNLRTESLKSVV